MNCVSADCKYVKVQKIEDKSLKYFKSVLNISCELNKSVSYPFIDAGTKDMRCECYKKRDDSLDALSYSCRAIER